MTVLTVGDASLAVGLRAPRRLEGAGALNSRNPAGTTGCGQRVVRVADAAASAAEALPITGWLWPKQATSTSSSARARKETAARSRSRLNGRYGVLAYGHRELAKVPDARPRCGASADRRTPC